MINLVYQFIQRCVFSSLFFLQVLKLQVILDNMLFQKLAALFVLMVFASHGVIGHPYPDVPGPEDTMDNVLGDAGEFLSKAGAQSILEAIMMPGLNAANEAEEGC